MKLITDLKSSDFSISVEEELPEMKIELNQDELTALRDDYARCTKKLIEFSNLSGEKSVTLDFVEEAVSKIQVSLKKSRKQFSQLKSKISAYYLLKYEVSIFLFENADDQAESNAIIDDINTKIKDNLSALKEEMLILLGVVSLINLVYSTENLNSSVLKVIESARYVSWNNTLMHKLGFKEQLW